MRLAAASLVAVLTACGCKTSGGQSPQLAADEAVNAAVTSGMRTASQQGPVGVPVRFNPADCGCPEWEVYAFGRWMRVFIDAPDSAAFRSLQSDRDELAESKVVGQFAELPRRSERNAAYPVFVVEP